MTQEEYIANEYKRARNNLYTKQRKTFGSRDEFAKWFIDKLKLQNFCCHYCKTSIFDINKLISAGLLKTRSVRGGGKRGPVLEIDKNDDYYNPKNCVLSCYYCNNDKSYTSTKEEYEKHFGANRKIFFDRLLVSLTDVSISS